MFSKAETMFSRVGENAKIQDSNISCLVAGECYFSEKIGEIFGL